MSRGHQLTAIDRKKQGVEDSTVAGGCPGIILEAPSERTYGGSEWWRGRSRLTLAEYSRDQRPARSLVGGIHLWPRYCYHRSSSC